MLPASSKPSASGEPAVFGEPPRAALAAWYPPWAHELADLYFSGTTSLFVIHGNVHDFVRRQQDGDGAYGGIDDFLATQIFGAWDVVLRHDLSGGLRPLAGSDSIRLQSMVQHLSGFWGDPGSWPADPDKMLAAVDQFLERNLLTEAPARRKSVAILLDYAQYLIPAGDLSSMARGHAARLVRLLSWAQNPYLKRVNAAVCLVAEKLSEVSDRLVRSPHVADIEVPLPDLAERERFVEWASRDVELSKLTEFTPQQIAKLASGLSLTSLNVLLSQARRTGKPVDAARFRKLKKEMIERQCQGLLEFVEPPHTLDLLVGQDAAKQRLREDADLITRGHFDAAPMGYLICGPVGTGKTFLAECYAGSIGIPCVKLRNFRSKYVGESEGNLEQMLNVLRSLGPVVVIIDEADAALGSRESDGDSGTSGRIFSMIASQMGDTTYRGKIVWMLLTSRPDLLPIDLKRQGRAEVHIPLFYPQSEDEIRKMFEIMARKNKVKLAESALAALPVKRQLSGADIESIVLAAKRKALIGQRADLQPDDLQTAINDFVPSAQGLEKEKQELAAVLECTQLNFLPGHWRSQVEQPDGTARLQQRFGALRQLLEE